MTLKVEKKERVSAKSIIMNFFLQLIMCKMGPIHFKGFYFYFFILSGYSLLEIEVGGLSNIKAKPSQVGTTSCRNI